MLFLVPDIAGTPTGGNVYNRRILDAWPEGSPPPNVVTWPVDVAPEDPLRGLGRASAVIVDSLCLQHEDALRALRAERPNARLILLAHYLNCVDPRSDEDEATVREREVLPLMDGAITPSEYVRDALIEAGMAKEAVLAVPPGLDDVFRSPVSDRSRREDAPQLLTVANVLEGKGLDVLLDALDEIRDLDWTWRLVGGTDLDPEYGESFRGWLQSSRYRDRVRWEGIVQGDAMPEVYDAADVFVLPTRFETCSMATREAMARGLPVVASRVGGLPENIGEAQAGRLVPVDDSDALTTALRELIADTELRCKMGAAARRRSMAFPTWETSARTFASFVRGGVATER